jgi:membrane dipeptidase
MRPDTAVGLPAARTGQRIVIDGSIAPLVDEAYIARLVASGVTAVNWTVCSPWNPFVEVIAEIAAGLELIDAHPDELLLVRTTADIHAARETGRVGMIFGPQNAPPADVGPHGFRILHELGVRIIQLTYNERNAYGDGAAEPANAGITAAGRWAIGEMNRLGIVVDVSHCGDRTTLEAIDASARPVLVTHANSRTLHPSPRNKTDEHLRALAARGGVIGITLWSPMLRFDRRPTIDDFVAHLTYVADLVGIEHVGIGSDHSDGIPQDEWEGDFGSAGRYPTITGPAGAWYGYHSRFAERGSNVTEFPSVIEAIDRLGLSDDEQRGVLGGNFLRVFREVWGS